jgi:3-deoxy-D-manno-octulosonic-acid transferase
MHLVLAQSVADAERLRADGALRVMVCGDLGADHTPHPRLLARGLDWRQQLMRPVVLLAGSREKEEAQVLAAWRNCPVPRPLLVVVPRHAQRCDEVAGLAASHDFRVARRSGWTEQPDPGALSHDTDIWLGEDPAEAALYYGCADIALLGGSFVPLGGGNPIEAAACGCPLLMGPNTFRHAQAARAAEHAGAAVRVASLAEAVPLAVALSTSGRRNQMVQVALQFAQTHRGAARMMADQVFKYRRRIAGDAAA